MGDDTKLTGQDLNDRAAELDIEGRGSMTADEKRTAIAKAEKKIVKNTAKEKATEPDTVGAPIDLSPPPAQRPDPETGDMPTPAAVEDEPEDPGSPLGFMDEIRPGHQSVHVTAAQVLLRVHGYQLGVIDGQAGRETVRAVRAFRADRGLDDSDRIDADVWAELSRSCDSAPQ